jgi:predicted N-formylglutamate amidohydrolase
MSIWDSVAAIIAAEQVSQRAAKALADNMSEENRRKYSALYAPYHSRIQALVDDYLTRKPLLANCHHTMMVGESLVVGVTVRANRSWLIWDCDAHGREDGLLIQ